MKDEIRDGTVFKYLRKKLKKDIDLSLLSSDDMEELNDEWAEFVDEIDEGEKMCVDKNGLCLLVAYVLEGIQRRLKS